MRRRSGVTAAFNMNLLARLNRELGVDFQPESFRHEATSASNIWKRCRVSLMDPTALQELKASIRTIPDYPRPGIQFRDITTLLGNAQMFHRAVDELVRPWTGSRVDRVAGIEARGFILGGAIAHQLTAGFVPIRKKGKLPHETVRVAYSLEYGLDEIEMHRDGVARGERIILVDDLIATGGTAEAAVKLLHSLGAQILAACFVIDLPDLGGTRRLEALDVPVRTLVAFQGH